MLILGVEMVLNDIVIYLLGDLVDNHKFFAKPNSFASRLMESSDSPMRLISPQMLIVFDVPVRLPWSSNSARDNPMEA